MYVMVNVPVSGNNGDHRTEQNRTLVYYSLTSTYIHVKTIIYDRNILVKNYERLLDIKYSIIDIII